MNFDLALPSLGHGWRATANAKRFGRNASLFFNQRALKKTITPQKLETICGMTCEMGHSWQICTLGCAIEILST